jgi:uncharacterized damage-inducible protein DinB
VAPLVALLRQLRELLERLSDEQYVQKPVGVVASSIAGHVRHSLDHFDALFTALATGRLDYDNRERGTDVERSRPAALAAIAPHERKLLACVWPAANQPLRMSALLDPQAEPVEVLTSVERELAFILSHTIHHNSLIAVMVRTLGVDVPPTFGYAPSTLAHQEGKACAR